MNAWIKRLGSAADGFLDKHLGGSVSLGKWTFYGSNAMHFAVNVWSERLGAFICFRPPVFHYGQWRPWYLYVSHNATPGPHLVAFGPGIREEGARRGNRIPECSKWIEERFYQELRASSLEHVN